MTDRQGDIDRILRRFRTAYRVRTVALTVTEEAVALALIAGLAALLGPGAWAVGIPVACLVVLVVRTVWLFRRTRLDPRRVDIRLGLGDRFATWIACRRPMAGNAALSWLERELCVRLGRDPRALGRVAAWRPWRPMRAVFPVLIALLLLALFFPPLPPGHLELPNDDIASVGGAGGAGEGGGEEPTPQDQRLDPEAPPDDRPPPDEAPPDSPEPSGPDGPEPDPKALLDDPSLTDAFAVPQFVGEGDGERRTVPAAVLEEAGGAPAPTPPPPVTGGETGGELRSDEPDPATFERALERALRARHVPPAERPFVRRWFSALVEEAR